MQLATKQNAPFCSGRGNFLLTMALSMSRSQTAFWPVLEDFMAIFRKSKVLGLIGLILLLAAGAWLLSSGLIQAVAQDRALPTHYGVFALHRGVLTELKRNPKSDMLYTAIGGADVIQSLLGPIYPDGNLRFIIFSPDVASVGLRGVRVNYLAQIANEAQPAFHLTDWGWNFQAAPVPNQPQMIELTSDHPVALGHFALVYNGVYDFEVRSGVPDPQHSCVLRQVFGLGVSYQPCQ